MIIYGYGLKIDPDKRRVQNEFIIELTKIEFDILYLLASNPGKVFTKEKLYFSIWNREYIDDDSNIMSHIGRLRKKLGNAGSCIETVWGVGYRFSDSE